MKFTDGYWQLLPGVEVLRPRQVVDLEVDHEAGRERLVVHASTAPVRTRGDTLNRPLLSVSFTAPADGVIAVRIEHHAGGVPAEPTFAVRTSPVSTSVALPAPGGPAEAVFTSGDLVARIATEGPWRVDFEQDGQVLTSSTERSVGLVTTADGEHFVHEKLALGVREHVYGLGERFGPLAKNGQSVDIWNADGGTSSEQAYKNVPFYVSDTGYGVFVDHTGAVSCEVGSEDVGAVQFSVPGEVLQYAVIGGPTPKDVLRRYTGITGRPPRLPLWSYGLWLSTSFTTDYDEATVTSFVEGMAQRDLPLSVFHFDCFWMRAFHWSDFLWDPEVFPDPPGMLARLHERGLRVCVWINPYIAQRSRLFEEGRERGYLVRRPDGAVWQTDLWQAGMALVDFTDPDAVAWFQGHLRELLGQGVDAFKTDFGERIPTDVVWHDGSDPQRMHNYYTHLYNRSVFELLEGERGEGEAVLFARSATAGGQSFPVHWGGDCESTYAAMGQSLRGGLSLSASGFGFWSHDIGGFEGLPDPTLFKRWLAFGLLSSHSRLHGSSSYRVPWAFDEEAVDVTRRFTRLKLSLMPYLAAAAEEAHTDGTPVMRPMFLELPDDPAVAGLGTQYFLGPDLLVAPVMDAGGDVDVYVPEGRWTSLLDGSVLTGPRWHRQRHAVDSLPVLVRPATVLACSTREDRPDHDLGDDVLLRVFELADGQQARVEVPATPHGPAVRFAVRRTGGSLHVAPSGARRWSLALGAGGAVHTGSGDEPVRVPLPQPAVEGTP